jgi:hypothetical protein
MEQIGFKVSNGMFGFMPLKIYFVPMDIQHANFNPSFHWFTFGPRLLIHWWLLHTHRIIFKSQRCWEVSLQLLMYNYHKFLTCHKRDTEEELIPIPHHITLNLKNVAKFSWQSFFYNLKHFFRYNQDFHLTSHITLQLILVGLINL